MSLHSKRQRRKFNCGVRTESSTYKCDFYFTDTTQRKNNYQQTAATLLNHHHQVQKRQSSKTKMMRETLGSVVKLLKLKKHWKQSRSLLLEKMK